MLFFYACFELTDLPWQLIGPLVSAKRSGSYLMRQIISACFYVVRTGCQWRALPFHYPPCQTVYYHIRRLQSKSTFPHIVKT